MCKCKTITRTTDRSPGILLRISVKKKKKSINQSASLGQSELFIATKIQNAGTKIKSKSKETIPAPHSTQTQTSRSCCLIGLKSHETGRQYIRSPIRRVQVLRYHTTGVGLWPPVKIRKLWIQGWASRIWERPGFALIKLVRFCRGEEGNNVQCVCFILSLSLVGYFYSE